MDPKRSVTSQELVDVLMVLTTEIVSALEPADERADAALETVASRLLDMAGKMLPGSRRDLIAALAKNLIQTEDGASPG
ncbi:MAG: hypothetical protein IV086_18815 [Hyphomonadaceae bacterium]|nr:MAG: hypothetical protein FD160_1690 [Caulobacteraceae bacterium]MBT9447750.1 hypothetical protein [Hyphomonadaceae bacterium]TPW02718.1 MAG: hypothetical protein FD124_3284 [Alphaproteobacteria bacterium]